MGKESKERKYTKKESGSDSAPITLPDIQGFLKKDKDQYIRVGTAFFKNIQKQDRFGIIRNDIKIWNRQAILDDYGKSFLQKIPKYDDFTIVPDNFNYSSIVNNCYNLYSEFSHKPKAGSWYWTKILLEHIFNEQYDLGIRYLQALYLHPDHLLPVLSLVSRERETGKTTFINWIIMVFGNNVVNITPQIIKNQFTGIYATRNIITIEETAIDKGDTVEKIKALSTCKFVVLNFKNVNEYQVPFFGKIILTSNNEDKFIRIDEDEIRFFVRKLNKPKIENHNIEKDLISEIPAFLYYLTTLPPVDFTKDRSGFTPQELENEYLAGLKSESKSGLYKSMKMYFEDLFLNDLNNETEFYADAISIKSKYYSLDRSIDLKYIRQVLNDEFRLTPVHKTIYFHPFVNEPGKNGKPYQFKREKFTGDPPEKKPF